MWGPRDLSSKAVRMILRLNGWMDPNIASGITSLVNKSLPQPGRTHVYNYTFSPCTHSYVLVDFLNVEISVCVFVDGGGGRETD